MHDQLIKTDFWQQHMAVLLRDGRPAWKPNQRFRGSDRSDSPVRKFARRKFQESVRSMVSSVYLAGRDEAEEE